MTHFCSLIKQITLNLFPTAPAITDSKFCSPVYPCYLFRIQYDGKLPYFQTWNFQDIYGKNNAITFLSPFIVSLFWNLNTSSWKIVARGPGLHDFYYNTSAILVSTRLNAMFRFQITHKSSTGKTKLCWADKNKEQMGGQIRLLPVSRPYEAIGWQLW